MKRSICLALVVLASSVALPAAAAGSRSRATTRFLGLDPHGPLARVNSKGALSEPEDTACRTWGDAKGSWNALDALGKVVGTARVSGAERYDVTNCDELELERASGERGVGIFVRGTYKAVDLSRFKPPKRAMARLARLIERRDARLPAAQNKAPDAPLRARMFGFRKGDDAPIVVVGGRALSVFRLERGRWHKLYEELPCEPKDTKAQCAATVWSPDIYKTVSALDMNGDGQIEIVVHEAFVDAYDDVTLTPDGKGGFKRVESGIHGAFA
ncbi:MAG: hypothetical protein U0271_45320 [Polyangiaceae bacterium]